MPLARAGMRRHLPPSAACGARVGAAESFVSFIPLLGGALLVDTSLVPFRVGLRFAHSVAQVCNADARDHRRIAQDGWRAAKVIEESNAGTKKKRYDVNVDFVEEASIQ